MHIVKPHAELFAHDGNTVLDNVQRVYAGYRRCYSDKDYPEGSAHRAEGLISYGTYLRKMMKSGHESPLEHATLTWHITCSRACSHQFVRHRIASYSQQSQRYVKMDDLPVIVPPFIEQYADAKEGFFLCVKAEEDAYRIMVDSGVPAEDARYLLPNAAATHLVVSMNFRTLLHFFSERCCTRAQWEIRSLADQMLAQCKEHYAPVFEYAGPKCIKLGRCPERVPCRLQPWRRKNDDSDK